MLPAALRPTWLPTAAPATPPSTVATSRPVPPPMVWPRAAPATPPTTAPMMFALREVGVPTGTYSMLATRPYSRLGEFVDTVVAGGLPPVKDGIDYIGRQIIETHQPRGIRGRHML